MPATVTSDGVRRQLFLLLSACHLGPTVAVTALAGLLCVAVELDPWRSTLLVVAVLAGQLSIGWSNDLIDLDRDRRSGRTDKPLASGEFDLHVAQIAVVIALLSALLLPWALGPAAGAAIVLVVLGGLAYNLGLKQTSWSWLPYAVAFGSLAAAPGLAAGGDVVWWVPTVGALLGVGAHLVNVIPDLDDDARTGVSGLPHRLADRFGASGVSIFAVALFVVASAVLLIALPFGPLVWVAGLAVLALATAALRTHGRRPFQAAIAIALVDVIALVIAV